MDPMFPRWVTQLIKNRVAKNKTIFLNSSNGRIVMEIGEFSLFSTSFNIAFLLEIIRGLHYFE